MEPGRRFGIFGKAPVVAKEPTSEKTIERWQQALAGESFLGGNAYFATLARKDDVTKKINAFVQTRGENRGARIDIPLIDESATYQSLFQQAYETSLFMGQTDPDRYRSFATAEFTRDHLIAFLNRAGSTISPKDMPNWFYETFGLNHLERYGDVYISSYGSYDTFNAVIESARDRADQITGVTTQAAANFVGFAQRSLPHLAIEPFLVTDYLNNVQSTLKFRPQDWDWV